VGGQRHAPASLPQVKPRFPLYKVGPGYRSWYCDSLRTGRSRDLSPVVARFSATVQNGSGAHPASYTMCTGSSPGVKRPRRGVEHQPPSSAEVKERVELYLYPTSGPSWSVRVTFTFTFTHCTGGWVGPRTRLDGCEKSRPATGIRSPDRSVRSE
jgi:hypothetical protein